MPHVMTKDEIQELIVTYRQYIAEGTTEEKMCTEEEMEEEIKNLEKQYESAPETAPELDHTSFGRHNGNRDNRGRQICGRRDIGA